MNLFVNISIFLGLISGLRDVVASNASMPSHFTGLLSDVLFTNRQQDLSITSLCNQELAMIQKALDGKDDWAIKRKCFEVFVHLRICLLSCWAEKYQVLQCLEWQNYKHIYK